MYLYYLLLVSPFYHLAIKPGRGASKCRDKDPDPVASVDFWPAGSGSITFSLDLDPIKNI